VITSTISGTAGWTVSLGNPATSGTAGSFVATVNCLHHVP